MYINSDYSFVNEQAESIRIRIISFIVLLSTKYCLPLDRSDRFTLTRDMDPSPYNCQISADSTVYTLKYLNVPYQVTYIF